MNPEPPPRESLADAALRLASRLARQVQAWGQRSTEQLLPFFAPSESKALVALSLLIGLLTGAAAYVLDTMIRGIFQLGMGSSFGRFAELPLSERWPVLFLPALGGLAVGLILHHLAPEAKGDGVPDVMEAIALRSGRIRKRVALLKTLCTSITLGSGGSSGREGPVAQIGASLGSGLAQLLRMPPVVLKTMAAAGAGAGIAAAFNAPLGGMAYALEVILGQITTQPFAMVVLSTVVASTVSRGLHGSASYFQIPRYQLHHPAELALYLVLGVLAGVVGKVFVKTLYRLDDEFSAWERVPPELRPAVGGLLCGAIGVFVPGVLGPGHEVIEGVLWGHQTVLMAGLLIFAKILATSLTVGSGGAGGAFMPSLFIGAMLGRVLGTAFSAWFPFAGPPGAYALVGMGACFAAVSHAPLTAILILFEMTYDYAIILPVMTATVSALLVSKIIEPESVYTLRLVRKGIVFRREPQAPVLESTLVGDVMTKKVETLSASFPAARLPRYIEKSRHSGFPVVDSLGNLVGLVTFEEVRQAFGGAQPPSEETPVKAIARDGVPRLHPDDPVSEAVRLMHLEGLDRLPVVDRDHPTKIVGMLTEADVVGLYGKRMDARRLP